MTAWTADGRFANAYFSIRLNAGGIVGGGASVVNGTLATLDAPSHARSGSYADYYRLTGAGNTTIEMTGFDSYLYLYDSQLRLIASNDDSAGNYGSRIATNLLSGNTYYVEATSFAPSLTGNYRLSVTNGNLSLTPNPWGGGGICTSIAGNYSVSEVVTMTITSQGQSETISESGSANTTITQTGCSFGYQAVDPSGNIPPVTRTGTINGSSLTLNGEAYVAVDPNMVIADNSLNASGTIAGTGFVINSSGYVAGTYSGVPFRINFTSRATFTRR